MGAHLQSLQRLRVTTELSGERVLAEGQKLQHSQPQGTQYIVINPPY